MYSIEAAILAGGQGRRMGYQDKGLVHYRDKPLIQHVIANLQPQVATITIIANRNLAHYQAFGFPVYQDVQQGYLGPLAGFDTALSHCQSDLLIIVPCDTPDLPADLVSKLKQQLHHDNVDVVMAADHEKSHPVVLLLKTHLRKNLQSYLAQGDRKVMAWCLAQRHSKVIFDSAHFVNINRHQPDTLQE